MVPPDRAAGAEWEMQLSATRDIDQGEELLLSYGAPALLMTRALSDTVWQCAAAAEHEATARFCICPR